MSKIIINNPEELERKKKIFKEGGKEKFQVITDFDLTMTRFMVNGQRGRSSHGVIEYSDILGTEYRKKTNELSSHYYPIEISDMPREEKAVKMVEWWSKAHHLFIDYGLKESHIKEALKTANIGLRERCPDTLKLLSEKGVPLLVFSAGLSNVIKEFLKAKDCFYPNMHVVSNRMHFGEDGAIKGFDGELIHTLNKNANILKNFEHSWAHDELRTNFLLMGDNITDVHMSDGLSYKNQISIGFLNDRIEERLEEFTNTFDIVITHDGSFEYVESLIIEILS